MSDKAKDSIVIKNNSSYMWYIVQVYSGFEQYVVDQIKHAADLDGLASEFEEFYYPKYKTEEDASKDAVKSKSKGRSVYPGYLFVKMKMSTSTWNIVSKADKVVSFVGSNKLSPKPLTEQEYNKMVEDVKESKVNDTGKGVVKLGDVIKIKGGSFQSLTGTVRDVDEGKKKVSVVIKIFDRETVIDLDWTQIEKLN